MAEEQRGHRRNRQQLGKRVGDKEARKLRARRRSDSIWFGLGMFGVIGWSVAIPTLLGILIGIWIDTNWPSRFSWTLMLLLVGVILGCLNAWHWVDRERRIIEEKEKEHDE
ncbi:MAG TPA: AtpZ/AtpI family protein [Spirillospora sp.]|nr:AtpZ/AtpI family protein [Spirillospora sp.]